MDINLMQDELNSLRSKIEISPDHPKFKKSIVGGYECEQVEAYIKSMNKASIKEQKLFEEKYEEATSFSAMMVQERDLIAKKLAEAEEKLAGCNAVITTLEESNELLNKTIEDVTNEIGSFATTDDLERKLAETERENIQLSKNLNEILESRALNISENAILRDRVQDLTVNVEKLDSENMELKEYIAKLKMSKRNVVVNTSTGVFEYQQKHNYNIERISNNINESLKILEAMKAESDDLYTYTQKNIADEQNI